MGIGRWPGGVKDMERYWTVKQQMWLLGPFVATLFLCSLIPIYLIILKTKFENTPTVPPLLLVISNMHE